MSLDWSYRARRNKIYPPA